MLSAKAKAFSISALLGKRSSSSALTEEDTTTSDEVEGKGVGSPIVNVIPESSDPIKPPPLKRIKTHLEKTNESSSNVTYKREKISLRSDLVQCSTPGRTLKASSGATCTLINTDLWQEFHRHETEMIITKTGRYEYEFRLKIGCVQLSKFT